jgi:hypothetical protein
MSLAACGTIDTVFRDESVAKNHMKKADTYCDFLPRVYSGLSYDFCYLNSEPSSHQSYTQITSNGSWPQSEPVPWPIVDMAFSGILDTAALPYTIYKQRTEGSIELD